MSALNLKYRADVDGLRAIAVLAVVVFHAFAQGLQGGFIGVDVFFVISGYLISTIIFGHLSNGEFSFIAFYARRIKRIFPALLLVLLVTVVLGWFVLLGDEYKQLGKQIAGGSAFVSNFILLQESGYFDNSADTKPLLHLWSLAIEEQFYLIWPLLLWCAFKLRLNLFFIAVVIASLSFILNILSVFDNKVLAFYSPQTRFWELMVGSVLAYLNLSAHTNTSSNIFNLLTLRRVWPNAFSVSGLFFIIIGFVLIKPGSYFPGWWAVLPTAGAALILASDRRAWLNRVFLSNSVLVWFGCISYPLYLWHWPLLSFARILTGELPSVIVRLGIVLLSVALAWLTFLFVERPIRFGKRSRLKVGVLICCLFGMGVVGFYIFKKDGLTARAVVLLNGSKLSGGDGGDLGVSINDCGINENEGKLLYASCLRDKRQPAKFALMGDSKAAAIYSGLVRTSHADGRWLVIGGTGSNGLSVLLESPHDIYKVYQRLTPMALDAVSRNDGIKTVVLVMGVRHLFGLSDDLLLADLPASKNYNIAFEALEFSINKLINANKKVVLVVDNPALPEPKDCIGRESSLALLNAVLKSSKNEGCTITVSNHLLLTEKYRSLLTEIQAKYPKNVVVFDTLKYMCSESEQVCRTFKNGRLMYSYGDHISDYAAGLIGQDLNDLLAAP